MRARRTRLDLQFRFKLFQCLRLLSKSQETVCDGLVNSRQVGLNFDNGSVLLDGFRVSLLGREGIGHDLMRAIGIGSDLHKMLKCRTRLLLSLMCPLVKIIFLAVSARGSLRSDADVPAQISYYFAQFCKVRPTMKSFPE